MSFIHFENVREKEKVRQDLKEAREHMLNEAKIRAELRADLESKRLLAGERNWMLPSVNEKLKKKNKELTFKTKKDKKHKKSKKKKHKKRKHSTSEDETESSDSSSDCTDSSLPDKHKISRKSKKVKKKNKKSTPTQGNSSCSEDIKYEKNNMLQLDKSHEPLSRDSWMTDALMLKTYSKKRVETNQNEKHVSTYDPAKSSRELNPYWKTTGTGLPSFQKPDDEDSTPINSKSLYSKVSIATKGWRKSDKISNKSLQPALQFAQKTTDDKSPMDDKQKITLCQSVTTSEFLTDQQMNELGAKILKAEIMGNMELAEELRGKLEKARTQRNIIKERKKAEYVGGTEKSDYKKDKHILLTHTDQLGNSRPLQTSKILDPKDLYGKKKKQKHVNSHDESGKRVRYFADDDRYDIKQMFESEKYASASDANLQFANIASKHKNTTDDLEDIFAEEICKDNFLRSDKNNRERAIREHKKMETSLDNCSKCFDSTKMEKELLVSVGEKVYLALPWYQGLQSGHCIIIPNQHVSCCTQTDEDTWTEINEFRKALTRMFASQNKDVIFFEIANKLHRRPHLAVHCIPIRQSDGEMAPFYFKKAIEESEHDWCVNKQLVSLRNKSLQNSIPKGLPYFWVNFGMDIGFAHVIEDEERFPPNFAQEIIGGMLNLDANKWRRPQKEQNAIAKIKMFAEWWKGYDCTK